MPAPLPHMCHGAPVVCVLRIVYFSHDNQDATVARPPRPSSLCSSTRLPLDSVTTLFVGVKMGPPITSNVPFVNQFAEWSIGVIAVSFVASIADYSADSFMGEFAGSPNRSVRDSFADPGLDPVTREFVGSIDGTLLRWLNWWLFR